MTDTIKSGDPTLSNKSFYFKSVLLTSDRLPNKEFDLAPVTVELEIFENITMPYLTGNIVFIDSRGVLAGVDIIGGEKIAVSIQMHGLLPKIHHVNSCFLV